MSVRIVDVDIKRERSDKTIGEMKKEATQGKGSKLVIIVLLVVVVVLLGIILAYVLWGHSGDVVQRNSQPSTREVSSGRMVVDQETADSVIDQMREEVAEGMFECQMSMTWNFADGNSESEDAYVANSTNNKYPIYFDVYLGEDDEELIYSSPLLPVGAEWHNFKLDKPLQAGEYKAKVMYTLVRDEESQEEISKAAFIISLNVRK